MKSIDMKEGIEDLLTELKLYGALEFYTNDYANSPKMKPETLLKGMFELEKSRRAINALKRRVRYANFPLDREWEQIDPKKNSKIPFSQVKKLSSGNFIKERGNICLIGSTGLGKTHSLVAIGKDLCRIGMTVKCYSACDLVVQLEEAKKNFELSKLMSRLMKPNFLIIDELGFVPFSDNGARLLFDVFSKRYENGSIGVTTNLAFNDWPQIFGSVELTTALIDRFTHKCEIYTYKGKSVRLEESKRRLSAKGPLG